MNHNQSMPLLVRNGVSDDVPALTALLNDIIKIGGTTAYQMPLSHAECEAHFISGEGCLTCLVCLDADQAVAGFQSLSCYNEPRVGWASIATFARVKPKIKGVGRALFEETRKRAIKMSINTINATIRADNAQGLAYYSKMGFIDYHVDKAVPLSDGMPVDRISKKIECIIGIMR